MKKLILLSAVSWLLLASASSAQVYKWVDEKGAVHYTDDVAGVPDGHRPTTEKMPNLDSRPEPKGDAAGQQDGRPSEKKEQPYKDRLGRGEEYWRNTAQSWRKKLTGAQEQAENLRLRYNDLTEKMNASKSSVERAALRNERDQVKDQIEQCKKQLDAARVMIDKTLPEEAELFKAKAEWLKL
jgi:hypothetical protein